MNARHVCYFSALLFVGAHIPFLAPAADTWPGFRGSGDSHATAANLPWALELRGRSAGNWSVRLPGYGQSSPVVWHDRIFVTSVSGDDKDHLHVLALSLADGKIAWQREFAGSQKVKDSDTVSRGAPTPVVDGERLYAVFESGDVFALTHEGALIWHRSFVKDYGEIKGPHGYASSPVLVNDLCVLQISHAGPSNIVALDRATGIERWRAEHPSQTGWSSPAVLRRGSQVQIIVSTSGSVRALDATTGLQAWVVSDVQGNSAASPTIAGDFLVIGASAELGGGAKATAAATTPRTGSATLHLGPPNGPIQPAVAWKSTKVSAGYASPVVLDGLAYFVNKVGAVQCVDVASGDVRWQHRLPGEVWASPVANNGHITFFCKNGQVVTLKGSPELVEVAESHVSTTDIVYGVAAVDGAWIVRTGRGLARISGPAEANTSSPPKSGD